MSERMVACGQGGRRRRLGWRLGFWTRNRGHRMHDHHVPATGPVDGPCSLAAVRAGEVVCVRAIRTDLRQARRLRELGLLEGKPVRLLSPGNPLICQVGECRFGLCQRLARCVLVEPVVPHPAAKSA